MINNQLTHYFNPSPKALDLCIQHVPSDWHKPRRLEEHKENIMKASGFSVLTAKPETHISSKS